MTRNPNYQAEKVLVGAASTAPSGVLLDFAPSYLRLVNNGSADVYVNFSSTNSTTEAARLTTGQQLEINSRMELYKIGLFTTSTGAGGQAVDILALG